ncbi:MAG: hypothetical protein K2K87_12090 [Lachnospiraceae bacterium]|nr:hypothetical protein [Lachnospiraceae bacterium]
MGLKNYKIDTSVLSAENQERAIKFIEINAFTFAYIPGTKGCYQCMWEENVNPRSFPEISECVIQELPSACIP